MSPILQGHDTINIKRTEPTNLFTLIYKVSNCNYNSLISFLIAHRADYREEMSGAEGAEGGEGSMCSERWPGKQREKKKKRRIGAYWVRRHDEMDD